ncbi:MAG: toll/interleukin-1 receptor domain-containing protein [Thiothrix sp.]
MPNPARTDYIFLSYSRTDKEAAETLRSRLIAAGFDVFRDQESIRIGVNWLQSLQEAVQGCAAFVRRTRWCATATLGGGGSGSRPQPQAVAA